MNKLWYVLGFLASAPLVLFASFTLLAYSQKLHAAEPIRSVYKPQNIAILSPKNETVPEITLSVQGKDVRAQILKNYMQKYNSPLAEYADDLVVVADEYNLDFRLLVAIARQESGLCKRIIPNSFNCWGYGIYGDNVIKFSNYVEGARRVAKTLQKYSTKHGLDVPSEIMTKYTPPALSDGGSWAKGVNQFMADME